MQLVIAESPEERLGESVVGRLSASGSFIVPAEGADGDALAEADSLLAGLAGGDEEARDDLAVSLWASGDGGIDFGLAAHRLDAVVFGLGPGGGAVLGAVGDSDSLESRVALDLDGGRGDLVAAAHAVASLASLEGWLQVQVAGLDGVLEARREGGEHRQDVSHFVLPSGLAQGVLGSDDLSQALELGIWNAHNSCC